jgi:uncharacterized protein YqgC (DUF456 family)
MSSGAALFGALLLILIGVFATLWALGIIHLPVLHFWIGS